MNEQHGNRSPEQIQRDLERTRAEMGSTLDTIQRKLTPGELFEQTLDYFRSSGSGEFSSNLREAVTQNPLPVAFIGVGIAWLAMGGSRSSRPSSAWGYADRTGSSMGEAGSRVADRAGNAMQGARERVGEMRERAGEMARGAQEQWSTTRERMNEMTYETHHRMGEAAGQVREQISSQAMQVGRRFEYLREEHPFVLGAIGLALGAIVAAGLPPTQREDELMGETRDEYLRRARETGEEQLEKAKRVATAAGEAAKEEAEKAGFTREGVDQKLREAGEKVERVAQASRDAAKEEANKQNLS